MMYLNVYLHFEKSVRIWSYSSPYFPTFALNIDQKNSKHGHFLRSYFFPCEHIFRSSHIFSTTKNVFTVVRESFAI